MVDKIDDAWKQWKDSPTPQNRSKLFDVANPVIRAARNAHAGDIGGKVNLQQVGSRSESRLDGNPTIALKTRELAQKAFESYDPDKGAGLKRHLMVRLQPLKRVVHQVANPMKIPQRTWWDLKNMQEAADRLTDRKGREPTARDLADETGINLKRIAKLRKISREPIPESVLRQSDPEAVLGLRAMGTGEDEWPARAVYYSLGETNKKIFEDATGMFGAQKKPSGQTAKDLGLSAGAVSQRRKRIADMLAEVEQMEAS